MSDVNQNFPIANGPIVNKDGTPTLSFLAWMRTLWVRTGSESGVASRDIEQLAVMAQGQGAGAARQAFSDTTAAQLTALLHPTAKADPTEAFLFTLAQATGRGPTKPTTYVLPASENISTGDLINAYVDAGVMTVRLADGSDPAKFCNGFARSGIASGSRGPVLFAGFNDKVTVSTGASEVWLSDVTPGAFTDTPPTTVGHLLQTVGTAVLGLGLAFDQGTYTIL